MSDQVPPFAPGGVYNSAFTGQQHETERDRRGTTPTPATMSMSQPPMLPPLQQQHHHQHYDGPQYAPQAMHHHHQPPPTYHAPGQFVYQNGAMQQPPAMPSNMLVNGQNGAMRYALPPQVDARNLASRNATSKQIKRRTKTGCLTCRKRRIKVRENQYAVCDVKSSNQVARSRGCDDGRVLRDGALSKRTPKHHKRDSIRDFRRATSNA